MNAPPSDAQANLNRLADFLSRLEAHPERLNPEWLAQQAKTPA
jgi:hypothetical protein